MLRRLVLTGFAAVLATGLSTFVGCGDSGSTTGDGENPELEDVVYETGATDEALEALLAATPTTDAAHAATFTWPADGDILTADSVPTFCWQAGPTAQLDPVQTPHVGALMPAPRVRHEATTFDVAARAVLGPLLGHVRPAYAHGDPVNGPGYFLVFSTASNDKLVRVFTTGIDYTPDADHWETLKGAGAEITATVTSATFDSNRIATDGGPWNGTPIKFTIH